MKLQSRQILIYIYIIIVYCHWSRPCPSLVSHSVGMERKSIYLLQSMTTTSCELFFLKTNNTKKWIRWMLGLYSTFPFHYTFPSQLSETSRRFDMNLKSCHRKATMHPQSNMGVFSPINPSNPRIFKTLPVCFPKH